MDISSLTINQDASSGKKIVNSKYRIIKKIGQGQYGKVLLAENLEEDRKYVAIKTINRIDKTRLITKTYLSHTTKIEREIQIMKDCDHPNVVKLYQVIDDLKFDKILLVLEYCRFGEIDWKRYNHYYEKHSKKDGITINKILRDVTNGLDYLHHFKNIIHRDLKPSNLLISHDNKIKISDFGVSLILENNANDEKELGNCMGTPAFYAPELCQFVNNRFSMISDLDKKVKIDARIDIWSLGVVLYCLIFNEVPFNGFNEYELFQNIVNKKLKFPEIKSSSRITEHDIEEFNLLKDLIQKLLEKDPKDRISIESIKTHAFTCYDLSSSSRNKFLNMNKTLYNLQNPAETGLASKIRRFFNNKPETSTAPPKLPAIKKVVDPSKIKDLEPVDDLLDSYFDDSSSFGSDVEENVDTTNILDSMSEDDGSKLKASESSSSLRARPSPLLLQYSTFTSPLKPPNTSMFSSTPSQSPTSHTSPVIIGERSPSTFKAIFSPSKRFFSRNRDKQNNDRLEPTIKSLSHSEQTSTPSNQNMYNDLIEPPSVFAGSATSSRKNSFSSARSGYGLSRITSSSSSLNLNAYLTDDALSIMSTRNRTSYNQTSHPDHSFSNSDSYVEDNTASDPDVSEVNSTLVLGSDSNLPNNYSSINDYLDNLD